MLHSEILLLWPEEQRGKAAYCFLQEAETQVEQWDLQGLRVGSILEAIQALPWLPQDLPCIWLVD